MKKFFKFIGLSFLGLIVLGILVGMFSEDEKVEDKVKVASVSGEVKKEVEKPYEIKDVKLVKEDYVTYIVGTLVSNRKETLDYVQVEFNVFDKSGAQVGSTLANVNNLKKGMPWKFKAAVLEEGVTKFELVDVTGF